MLHLALLLVLSSAILVSAQTVKRDREPEPEPEQPLKPTLKFPTRESYEKEIAEPAILLQSDHLWLFAPKRKTKEATIILKFLTSAYEELHRITGVHTKYKMIVYHSPKGWGGTSECVIEYDYSNLDFDQFDEWKRHKIPHVSGYIEEMAHNFVSTTRCQFGWEMVGWSLGVKATQKVAPNPIFNKQIQETRQKQAQTFTRYRSLGNTFPPDVEANLCDRIHAHLLYQCEMRYGPAFYSDFFTAIRKEKPALDAAIDIQGDDNVRNERYRITVECFDKLPKLNFKQLLVQHGISPTVDIKSLHPTDPGWNRKFTP